MFEIARTIDSIFLGSYQDVSAVLTRLTGKATKFGRRVVMMIIEGPGIDDFQIEAFERSPETFRVTEAAERGNSPVVEVLDCLSGAVVAPAASDQTCSEDWSGRIRSVQARSDCPETQFVFGARDNENMGPAERA